MKRIFFILTALLFICEVQAQKETNIWHFGYNAGLDFNNTQPARACKEVFWSGSAWTTTNETINNLPTSIPGYVSTAEGCFTISDSDGNLLMSSDGSTLYNKNGGTITTGLGGSNSATQSGIVIPKPGDPNRYYTVSVPNDKGYKIQYAEVDMSLNNGLGGIISQNNAITDISVFENIAAIPHSNGVDYWLLYRTSDNYYVWKVTNSGFSLHGTTPTGSTVTSGYDCAGELIVSPDGTRIAAMTYDKGEILTADFDPTTGSISKTQSMKTTPLGYLYGGCFSPNGEYLYYTYVNIASTPIDAACVSWTALRSGSQGNRILPLTNIHCAADGRLYGIVCDSQALYVVEDPDNGSLKVKYTDSFFSTVTAKAGLPTFLSSYFRTNLKLFPLACNQNAREISVEITSGGTSPVTTIDWDFGDGATATGQTITPNTTQIYSQIHTYTTPGIKTITITPRTAGGIAKAVQSFQIEVIPCAIKTNRMIRTDLKDLGEP